MNSWIQTIEMFGLALVGLVVAVVGGEMRMSTEWATAVQRVWILGTTAAIWALLVAASVSPIYGNRSRAGLTQYLVRLTSTSLAAAAFSVAIV